MAIVNSWNEWDALREVFLGTMEGKQTQCADEPPVARKYENSGLFDYEVNEVITDAPKEAAVCVERFGEVLKGEGIKVSRPDPMDYSKASSTPIFDVDRQSGATCPRDVFFVCGNNVIEAPMSWRCRYFEHMAWRTVMMNYWERDPNMRWTCAPKPLMADSSYEKTGLTLNNNEIMFDAADCRRFGKDIFCQRAHTANDAGREWMKRTLGADGIRVHEFEFHEEATYSHIDAKITPVGEYTMLYSASERPSDSMLQLFKENDWKMIEAPARMWCTSKADQTGPGIHLNMLVLDNMKVVVEENEKDLIKVLRDEGVDTIPIRYAPAYQYGGALNCWTLDISRDGTCQSYFPTLDAAAERESAKEVATPCKKQRTA